MISSSNSFSNKNIDEVRSYWNARPCNIRHSIKEIGTKDYFNEVEARKYFVEPHIPLFAEFDKWRGKKVLEIGCGIGTDTINFARAGAKVTAVDLSENSLELARKRADVFGYDVNFYHANAEELSKSVPIEEYDLVYSFGVIHHTPQPDKAIAEIRKYMGKDSQFKIMVYNRNSWKVLWILLTYGKFQFSKLDEWVANYSEAQTGCPVTYSYTKKSIQSLLKGFDIQDLRVDHIFPYSISEYKQYEYKKIWYFQYLPKSLFRFLERNFGWHLCVTSKLK
ncbi:class I SAM-dependent methyltransferase [Metabacillus herbersteinensis]|uniref:Class I SAM-dependent methyltransferase n=1 Tax=Metabacillus herbersteinensis TaxID=283816 RepID=A0ABV6GE29_9BACI